jgi:hypothetical protein
MVRPRKLNSSQSKNVLSMMALELAIGMHEWAMLYNPDTSSSPPPSSKYQSHLPLRIPQQVINEQVERKGVRCTHIDALRFFAPEARKWNWYGSLNDLTREERDAAKETKRHVEKLLKGGIGSKQQSATTILTRTDQLHLEQKGCLHANMDLFKIAWRLQPFISSDLIEKALTVALRARTLDVEASPYDVSSYVGLDWSSGDLEYTDVQFPYEEIQLSAVKIETENGKREYQKRQFIVMRRGEVVRKKLLAAYDDFLMGVFDIHKEMTVEFYNSAKESPKT